METNFGARLLYLDVTPIRRAFPLLSQLRLSISLTLKISGGQKLMRFIKNCRLRPLNLEVEKIQRECNLPASFSF
jgi:hypothetical protein